MMSKNYKELLLDEIESLDTDHPDNIYIRSWNYYVKSCYLSREQIVINHHIYCDTVPLNEAIEIAGYTHVGGIPLDTLLVRSREYDDSDIA